MLFLVCAHENISTCSNSRAIAHPIKRHCQSTQHSTLELYGMVSLSLSLSLSSFFFLDMRNIRKKAEYLGQLKSKFRCTLHETVTLFARRSTVELKLKSRRGKCSKFSEVFLVVIGPFFFSLSLSLSLSLYPLSFSPPPLSLSPSTSSRSNSFL